MARVSIEKTAQKSVLHGVFLSNLFGVFYVFLWQFSGVQIIIQHTYVHCFFIRNLQIPLNMYRSRHVLRSNTISCDCKNHWNDSKDSIIMAPCGRKMYYLPFAVPQSFEKFGYTFIFKNCCYCYYYYYYYYYYYSHFNLCVNTSK